LTATNSTGKDVTRGFGDGCSFEEQDLDGRDRPGHDVGLPLVAANENMFALRVKKANEG
jgi:hypothetical protein